MSLDQLLQHRRNPGLFANEHLVGERRVFDSDVQIHHYWAALNAAVRAIESAVEAREQDAKEAARKEDYSGAGRNQAAAVDLHCAVALVVEALFPHGCSHPGFSPTHGDSCPGCELAEWRARNEISREVKP